MSRPAPRRSALAGTSVVTSRPPVEGSNDGKSGNTGNAGTPGNAALATQITTHAKVSVRLPEEVASRARGAFWATGHLTGIKSLSEWVADAIATKLVTDEQRYNNGQPFPSIEPGEIPTGRRP